MSNMTRILVVEDNPTDFDLAQREVQRVLEDCVFKQVQTHREYQDELHAFHPDVILVDLSLSSFDGMQALQLAREHLPFTRLIIWTGSTNEEVAAECMKAGAHDYILKENLSRLGSAVLHALEERQLLLERNRADNKLRRSEMNYRTLAEHSLQGIAIFQQQRIVYANPAMCAIMGYTSDELLAMLEDQILALTHPEDRAMAAERAARRRAGETISDVNDVRILRKDGTIRWIQTYATTLEYDDRPAVVATSIDITERKLAEEKLRAQDMRFRALIENGTENISLLAADGTLLWENPSTSRTLGYEPSTFLHRNIFELMHPEDLHWTRESFSQIIQEPGAQQRGIFRLKHSDGSWRWVEATATNMLQEPSVQAVIINYRDITERKNAEQQLRENQSKYRNLVETSHDLIWAVDADGRFTFVNAAARVIYGYEPEELIGRFYFDMNDPEHDHHSPETFRQAISGRTGYQEQEIHVRHRDGRQIILSANSIVLRDKSGSVIGMTGTSRDITEQKRAEQVLREDRNLLRTLIDHLPDRIYAMDRQGRKTMSNAADWAASGGKKMEDVIGKTEFDLYPTELAEPFWQLDQQVMESGCPVINCEEPGLDPEGNRVLVLTSKIPLRDESGNVVGLVGIGRDITERKHTEEELRQKNDDLRLLNVVNNAVVRGQDLKSVIDLLARELKRIFSAVGSTIYMLSADKRSLTMQQFSFSLEITHRIEKLIGRKIPRIEIPIREGGQFHNVLITKQSAIINDPQQIQEWIAEFLETRYLPAIAGTAVRKLIPQIFKLLNVRSAIIVPLISHEDVIGFLDVSSAHVLTPSDLKRIEIIGEQLTSLIQRQQVNEQVRQSEEFLQGIQNALSAHIAVLDQQGTIFQVNDAWREFGDQNGLRDPNYCIGTNYLAICEAAAGPHADLGKATATAIRQVLSGAQDEASLEYACHSPTEKRWFTVHVTSFENDQQKWVIVAHENITEQVKAEKASTESAAQFRTLFEASPDAIMLIDPAKNWTIIDCNSAAAKMHGYRREELLGQPVEILNTEPSTPESNRAYLERIKSADVLRYETVHIHKDGTPIAIEVCTTLIQLGERSTVLVIDRDITERKQAEYALRESESRYRAFFEDMPIAIWEEDFSDVKEYLDALKQQGVSDFAAYFEAHPQAARECTDKIRIRDVNNAALQMYEAASKLELIENTNAEPSIAEKEHNPEDFVAIAEGRMSNSWEGADETLRRNPIQISLSWSVVPGYENDYSKVIVTTRDITQQKRAEAQLRQSEERYRTVVQTQAEFIVRWKPNGTRTFANDPYCRYFGITAERALHSDFMPLVYEEDRLAVESKLARLLSGATGIETDVHRVIRSDGSIGWNEWTDQAIYSDDGVLVELQSVGRDITERKQAEIALQQSQARYQALFEEMPIAVWEDDLSEVKGYLDLLKQQGVSNFRDYFDTHPEDLIRTRQMVKILDVNKTALHMYQANSKEELIRSTLESLGPGEQKHWVEDLIAIANGQISNQWEGSDETINHIPIEISLAWSVAPGHEHDFSKVIVTTVDITERKRAENELRASEERFRQLAANIEEVFWMTEAETGKELYASPAVEKLWGVSMATVLEEPDFFMRSIVPADRAIVLNGIEREKRGDKVEMEYRIVHPDGSIHWIWDRAFPIFDEDGNIKILAGISADITERKHRDLEIRRHLTELEALYENGLNVGRLLEPREIGNQIIETFARHLSWHHVAIRLSNPETGTLELIAFNQPDLSEESRAEVETRLTTMVSKVGEGLSGWSMQIGQAIRTGNVNTHPQYVDTHQGTMSGLYMPLKVGNRVTGCISVESDQPDAFTAQDERLLATLANQAAIAFENARLYQSIQQELSERKRAQQALWTSETHYRQLADSITDILFEMDHNLCYTHWNKASEMFYGFSEQDVIGRSIRDVFGTSEEQLEREAVYRKVLQERQATAFEMTVIARGQQRDLEISAYPSARGVSVVARDITERKVFEALLQKRFELIEYSIHHSLADVMQKVVDDASTLTGSHVGFLHLVEADEQTISLQAWSTETIETYCRIEGVGTGMHYPLDQAGAWADAVRERRPLIYEDFANLQNKKGMPLGHVEVKRQIIIPVMRNEKVLAVIGVGNKEQEYTQQDIEVAARFADYAWDITERRRIENELAEERNQLAKRVEERTADLSRANANLARALRVKDEFLANMSHELRTPLNAILGLSESLSEQVAGPLNEKQSKYLSTINESGHHLLSLINDILDLAKIEAGQITLDINKVDVNSLCQASLRMIKQLAQKKNQEVTFSIDPHIGWMWADERRLKQMIVNLLSNAVKFTPAMGKLGLEVGGDREGNMVSISVWDNGIGISNIDMERIFKPFVQLDSGLAREATGTGLGLALVTQMAQMHGGSVTVESEFGRGSRFTIKLPWEPALAGDNSSRLRSTGKFLAIKPGEVRPTILLIEDTQEVVMMLVDYLEMAGFNMVTAQDGVDGLTQAKIAHPDLILMDIQMPRMDGFETAKRLRSDPEFKETPIIALTALAMPNDRQRCMDAGMNEYLSKPVNLKVLSKTMKAFLYEEESHQS